MPWNQRVDPEKKVSPSLCCKSKCSAVIEMDRSDDLPL